MEKLIEDYKEKHGVDPFLEFFQTLGRNELFKTLEKAKGRKIVIVFDNDNADQYTVKFE